MIVSLEPGWYTVSWNNTKYYGTSTPKATDPDECLVEYQGYYTVEERTLLPQTAISTSRYISDGLITSGSKDYRVGCFYVEADSEVTINTSYAITRTDLPFCFLVKYTDNTYSTYEKIIVQTPSSSGINQAFYLESGFYAVSWNNPGASEIVNEDECTVKIKEYKQGIL